MGSIVGLARSLDCSSYRILCVSVWFLLLGGEIAVERLLTRLTPELCNI